MLFLSFVTTIAVFVIVVMASPPPSPKRGSSPKEKEPHESQQREGGTGSPTKESTGSQTPHPPMPPVGHQFAGGASSAGASGRGSGTTAPLLGQSSFSSRVISGLVPRFPVAPIGPAPGTRSTAGLGENVEKNVAGGAIGGAGGTEGSSRKHELGDAAEGGSSTSPVSKRLMLGEPQQSGISELQCPECGKTFSSRKAVFGHLRAHPQRTWRGMSDAPVQPSSQVLVSPHKKTTDTTTPVQAAPFQVSPQKKTTTVERGDRELLQNQLVPTLLNIAQQTLGSIGKETTTTTFQVQQGLSTASTGAGPSTSASASGPARNIDLNAEPQNSDSPPAPPALPAPPPQAPQEGGGGAAVFDLNMPPPADGGNGNDDGNEDNAVDGN